MRQTEIKNCFSLFRRVLVALLCLVLLPSYVMAQGSTTFQDLPKDHWAYADVDFLISQGYMEGYPDGTFKGRKVTTRYDVALIVARILKRMEEKKATIDAASEEERAALTRLTKEFRDELGLLDVRVDSLERRMVDNENKVKKLENLLPKVKMSGFYRARGQYILKPKTVDRNEKGDTSYYFHPQTGLMTFYQELYLRFTGKPLGDKLETFYELYGYMKGKTFNKLMYNNAGNSGQNPFDNVDDYVTQVRNDSYVKSSKLHMISRAKSMKFRVWSGEYATGLDDPMNLLTEDTDIVKPFEGIEVSGSTDKGFSYQGSVLKSDNNLGNEDETDMITGRLVWELPESFSKDSSFTVGTTYAEKIPEYKTKGNSNAVRAVDLSFSTEKAGKIQGTAEFLTSRTYLPDSSDNDNMKNLEDSGRKFDLSFQEGGFTGTFKHYNFGRNFRANMAPVWAYDVGDYNWGWGYPYNEEPNMLTVAKGDNYGRDNFRGEKANRFSLNYDFGNKLLSFAKNISLETTYLDKSWEEDPNNPDPTDGRHGKKYTFQLISDFNDNTTIKYDFVKHEDALEDEEGSKSNALELNLKVNDTINTKGKIFMKDDPDDVATVGADTFSYQERVGYFEINSDINPRVFLKGSIEHSVCWSGTPKENTRIDYIGEATYNLTPTTSLTGGIQHVDYEDSFEPSNSSLANAIIAELKKNFTNKFRGRAFYSRAIIDYKNGNKDSLDRENLYAELIYNISKDATITFKFGYDYPDEWKWAVSSVDNGRDFVDIHTQKMFVFEAKSTF